MPLIGSNLQARLDTAVAWAPTNDLYIPGTAEVNRERWDVRINDFPEEYMYSLLVDGSPVGEFDDWPDEGRWNRGAAGVVPSVQTAAENRPQVFSLQVSPERWLTRYQAGEFREVWKELMSLGPDVRQPKYARAAEGVAKETMRRQP